MSATRPNPLEQYNTSFLQELEKLNAEQRQAVEQTEGPVLVIAGPGTGKTHILSARIGRILMETDTLAQNILCLTFTDAGVKAMRQRLLDLIGPEAHRVHIFTFHSFCNNIIQENLEYFGRHDLESISDLERVEIIRNLLDELEPKHPLRLGRPDSYFFENHLYDLFQKMKAEDWSVADISNRIDEYLADLPNRREYIYQVSRGTFIKGALKQAKYDEEVSRMEMLRSAAELYPRFGRALQEARRYDYDDMILWVIRAFEENEALLRTYQEQYLYFLVDEFQDTNGAQNEILNFLTAYWDNPNLFIVGDDDQSIYEFQGARLKNLTDFYDRYREHLQLVVLKNNYRSSQKILDSSRELIRRNERRIINNLEELGLEKNLTASNPAAAGHPHPPEVNIYPNRRHEEADIASRIKALLEAGIPAGEIAVIYARHRQAAPLLSLLEKQDIPYTTRRRINVLDLPMVRNLRLLLEYLQLEAQRPYRAEHLLFRMLHFDFFGIDPQLIAHLSWKITNLPADQRPQWRDIIGDPQFLQDIPGDNQPLLQLSDFLRQMLAAVSNTSLPNLLELVINGSGLLHHILEHPDKIWHLQVVKTFFDFVREEAGRRPRLGLNRLLDILRSMDANRLSIPLRKTLEVTEGVQFLTAHSAKGLEFEHVFLIDAVEDYWEPRSRRNNYSFKLPDTLTLSGEEDALEARRRLFYVALTRARTQLHISYSREDQGKELQRCRFIDELPLHSLVSLNEIQADAQTLETAEVLQMTLSTRPRLSAQDPKLIATALEGFSLSVSAMNRYLRCPLAFYYQHVLRVPVLQSEAASYGLAMHNALERLFEQLQLSKDKHFASEAQFIQLFEWEMEKLMPFFSPKEYQRRLETGRQNLTAYYRQHVGHWHKNVRVELNVRNTEVDGVPINGMIDKLELYDKARCHIVDYKTGSRDAGKLRRPGSANPQGGSYWRQLVFYKILYESSDRSGRKVEKGSIAYLEPDTTGHFPTKTLTFNAEDVRLVRGMIKETFERIMAHDFYEGCGERNCPWCSFLRRHQHISSFSMAEIEELDD
ncbi:MAG: ATP-dependent DNA helicase [Saprospiraceae bacterium]|nr:ATP-dependent helicase [Lewinella sp.]